MIIEKDKVLFENANKPHGYGEIDPNNFVPFPKNPTIAKIFREIGFADELGSGVKNLFKYTKKYGGANPRLLEKDIFQISIAVFIDVSKDAKFLLGCLNDEYCIHYTNTELEELHVKSLIEKNNSSTEKHLIYTQQPKNYLKYIREYCEVNGSLEKSILSKNRFCIS